MTVSWSINLPMPPSVNAMFVNRGREGMKGRMVSPAYAAWRKRADDALWAQTPIRRFSGEVAVCIALGPTKGLSDIDGRIKAPLDLLVRHKIIEDDNSKYVRMILASWDDAISGCKITISSMAELSAQK